MRDYDWNRLNRKGEYRAVTREEYQKQQQGTAFEAVLGESKTFESLLTDQDKALLNGLKISFHLIVLLFCISSAFAQLPEAPVKQPIMTHRELIESSELLAVNIGDYTSTERGIAKGGWIDTLPASLVDSKPGFLAYKLATVAGEVEAMRLYDRLPIVKRHKALQWAGFAGVQAIAVLTLKTDINNYSYNPKHLSLK